jgi:hypothetical protein
MVLGVGLALGVLGAGRQDRPPAPTSEEIEASGGDTRLAGQLATLRAAADHAPGVEVHSKQLGLTVSWHAGQQAVLLTIKNRQRLTDHDGKVWALMAAGCWRAVDLIRPPALSSVLLPLAAAHAKFSAPQAVGGAQVLRFEASQMGSYGAGSGQITVRDGAISGFSYQPDASARKQTFVVRYLTEPKLPKLQPVC